MLINTFRILLNFCLTKEKKDKTYNIIQNSISNEQAPILSKLTYNNKSFGNFLNNENLKRSSKNLFISKLSSQINNNIKEQKDIICLSINTFGKNLNYIYIGFLNENEEISSQKICLCEIPENCFYIRADEETIYQEKSTIKTVIESKTNLNLKFILNLKSKTLNIQNYDSNISYGTINITGNIFKFFVGKCCGTAGTIEYSLIPF